MVVFLPLVTKGLAVDLMTNSRPVVGSFPPDLWMSGAPPEISFQIID